MLWMIMDLYLLKFITGLSNYSTNSVHTFYFNPGSFDTFLQLESFKM